ncbi:hypothetical protein [Luteolibacter sp. Populi]|uniref:hypothetical protein n=1 Tax=Luteolibacter sp. Populi TaxID=3230487 RepID=UPI0034669B95
MTQPDHAHEAPPAARVIPAKRSVWKRLGGGSLSISVLLHVILLVIGVFWVLRVVKPPEKTVDFMPNSGGGGAPASQSKALQRQARMIPTELSRVAAVGAESKISLPEPDDLRIAALEPIGSSTSGGMGGQGSGGGKGNGKGTGIGDGTAPGMSRGSGAASPFGMLSASGNNMLVGNFYDLKQTKDGQATGVQEAEALKILSDFLGSGRWSTKILEQYYKAPNTLYQTKIYIPIMSAALAPEAFGCAKDVQPVNWVAHYRGMVSAPKAGKFRFVGRADNVMVVRFNNKVVLDGGDYSAGLGRAIWDATSIAVLAGKSEDRQLEREMRRGGYDIPVKSYNYAGSGQYNERGGVMVGKDFTVRAGQKYPIEIMMSELGGLFGAALMIEEDGVKYDSEPGGAPILPLFQVDDVVPTVPVEGRGSPAFDPKGPVWKAMPGVMPDKI